MLFKMLDNDATRRGQKPVWCEVRRRVIIFASQDHKEIEAGVDYFTLTY